MTSNSQMQEVQQEIKIVSAQIVKADGELLKARADSDNKEVDFLRDSLLELRRQLSALREELPALREERNIILRAQAPGQHCLPCRNCLKAHTLVCAHVRAHFPRYAFCSP